MGPPASPQNPGTRQSAVIVAEQSASDKKARNPLPWLLLIFAGYFLLQAISRGLISETLGVDESEQALLAQKWSWGYGPQPPLYTWLVIDVSKLLGLSSFSLALLKNALLLGIFLLTYFITQRLTQNRPLAVVAAAALELMPSIAYEAQRELTHSILASFMVLLTLLIFLRLQPGRNAPQTGSGPAPESMLPSNAPWGTYALFGMAGGLGILSKYNYTIFFIGLLLAGLSLKPWRASLLNPRAAAALAIMLIIIAPNLLWMRRYPDLAFASMGKFDIDPTHSVKSMVHGIGSWLSTFLDQIGILLVVFALLCGKAILRRRGTGQSSVTSQNNPAAEAAIAAAAEAGSVGIRLLTRIFLFTMSIIVLGIIVSGATNCRNRWLQPLVIPAPILVACLCHEQLTRGRQRIILWLAALVALGVAIASPVRILLTEKLGKREGLNIPFRALAHKLEAPLKDVPVLYCADTSVAGNLRIWFPQKIITAPMSAKLFPPSTNCALIWDPSMRGSAVFVSREAPLIGRSPEHAIFVEELMKYHHRTMSQLGVLLPETVP